MKVPHVEVLARHSGPESCGGYVNMAASGLFCLTWEQEVSDPLKVATICHFRGIDVQVRIFGLEMAKRAFPAEICPWKWHFCPFQCFRHLPEGNTSKKM